MLAFADMVADITIMEFFAGDGIAIGCGESGQSETFVNLACRGTFYPLQDASL